MCKCYNLNEVEDCRIFIEKDCISCKEEIMQHAVPQAVLEQNTEVLKPSVMPNNGNKCPYKQQINCPYYVPQNITTSFSTTRYELKHNADKIKKEKHYLPNTVEFKGCYNKECTDETNIKHSSIMIVISHKCNGIDCIRSIPKTVFDECYDITE